MALLRDVNKATQKLAAAIGALLECRKSGTMKAYRLRRLIQNLFSAIEELIRRWTELARILDQIDPPNRKQRKLQEDGIVLRRLAGQTGNGSRFGSILYEYIEDMEPEWTKQRKQ